MSSIPQNSVNLRKALFFIGFALTCAGCDEPVPRSEPVRPVRAFKVGDLKALVGREFPGRAKASVEVDLSFQVSGPLVALPVDVGTVVKKGDVIATIDPRDFQAALDSNQGNLERARANLLAMERGARPEEIEQLKSSLVKAQATYQQINADYERDLSLYEKKVVTKATLDRSLALRDRAAAEVKIAQEDLNIGEKGARPEDLEAKRSEIRALEAAVNNAKNQLEYSVLSAPFDGEIAARYVDNFQTIQAKQSIVRLLDVSKIEVTVQVPESLITLVPQVKSVSIQFDAFAQREFVGRVSKIGSEASLTTRTYPVTVQIDQPEDVRVLPGMAATVRNRPEADDAPQGGDLVVPPSAVFTAEEEQKSYVWVVNQDTNTVARREVVTGNLTQVGLTITEGLKVGELVVTSGVNSLSENQTVTILPESRG